MISILFEPVCQNVAKALRLNSNVEFHSWKCKFQRNLQPENVDSLKHMTGLDKFISKNRIMKVHLKSNSWAHNSDRNTQNKHAKKCIGYFHSMRLCFNYLQKSKLPMKITKKEGILASHYTLCAHSDSNIFERLSNNRSDNEKTSFFFVSSRRMRTSQKYFSW